MAPPSKELSEDLKKKELSEIWKEKELLLYIEMA